MLIILNGGSDDILNPLGNITIGYSDFTDSFYLTSDETIFVKKQNEDSLMTICEHKNTIEKAIDSYFEQITNVQYIKVRYDKINAERRYAYNKNTKEFYAISGYMKIF